MTERGQILAGLAAEVAFAVLPLVVVLIVVGHAGHSTALLASPEWSFGAAIIYGQALAKFVAGLARGGGAAMGPVTLTVALLVVFGLVPSLLFLTMTLQAIEEAQEVAMYLRIGQVILFGGGALAYVLLGAVGEMWRKSR